MKRRIFAIINLLNMECEKLINKLLGGAGCGNKSMYIRVIRGLLKTIFRLDDCMS